MKYINLFLLNIVTASSIFANSNVPSDELAQLQVINERQLQAYNNGIECFSQANSKSEVINCAVSMDKNFITELEKSTFGVKQLIKYKNWSNNVKNNFLVMLNTEKKYFEEARKCLPLSVKYSQLALCKGPLAIPSKERNYFKKSYQDIVKSGEYIYKSKDHESKSDIFRVINIKLVKDLPNKIELQIEFQYLQNTIPRGKKFVGFFDVDNKKRTFYTTPLRQVESGINIGTVEIYLEDYIKESVQTNNLILDFGFSKDGEVSYVFTKKIPYQKVWVQPTK